MERPQLESDHEPAVKGRLRQGGLPLLAALALVVWPAPLPTAGSDGSPALAEALASLLDQPAFARAQWGVRIARADSGEVLFERNPRRLLKPASNAKLFTAALALDALGPDHRVGTEFIPTGPITRNGSLRGDLIVVGQGDFTLSPRFHGGDPALSLDPVVETLLRTGLRRVEGGIVVDNSHHRGAPFGGGWTWDDLQNAYGAETGTLNLDDNVLDFTLHPGAKDGDPVRLAPKAPAGELVFHLEGVRTGPPGSLPEVRVRRDPGSRSVHITGRLPAGGDPWEESVSLPSPERHFALRLQQALGERGVRVRGGIRVDPGAASRLPSLPRAPRAAPVTVPSLPLSERVRRMMKPSQNLYAQLLLQEAGTTISSKDETETSEARGLRAMGLFLERAGIPGDEVFLDDGSGLSRSTLVTPAAVVGLLRFMDRHPTRELFLDTLPVAGVDGTLRTRLRGTPAEGNLRAKTGSLRFVSTLSGFVTNAAGHRLVFSLMLNAYQPPPGATSGRNALDQAAVLLTRSHE